MATLVKIKYLLGPELSAIVEMARLGFGGTGGEILWGKAGKFWIKGLGGTGGGIGLPMPPTAEDEEGVKDIMEIDMLSILEKEKKVEIYLMNIHSAYILKDKCFLE